MHNKQRRPFGSNGFTLVEVLLAVGIVVVLLIAVVSLLNPGQLLDQGRDGNRIAGIGTLDKAVELYYSNEQESPATLSMGTSSVVYVSIPDPGASSAAGTDCSDLGFVSTQSVTYHCAAPANYLKTDGTGWIPINFSSSSIGSSIPALPVDPVNTTTSGEYYVYITNGAGGYELMANPEATKDLPDTADFIKGSNLALLTTFPTATGGGESTGENFWVVDTGNNRVEEFSANGTYESQFGSEGSGNGQFSYPQQLAIDGSGNIWVTDYGNCRVEEFSANGTYESQFGSCGSGDGQFGGPDGIAIDASGHIWVGDYPNYTIQEFSSNGTWMKYLPGIGRGPYDQYTTQTSGGLFNELGHMTFGPNGNLYVADVPFDIQEFKTNEPSPYVATIGEKGDGPGQFEWPSDIAFDASGNIYIPNNGYVEKFDSSGDYLSEFGNGLGSDNGQFHTAGAIAIDTSGNIWVTDYDQLSYSNDRVQEFSSNGTYLSQFGSTGSADGNLHDPLDIAIVCNGSCSGGGGSSIAYTTSTYNFSDPDVSYTGWTIFDPHTNTMLFPGYDTVGNSVLLEVNVTTHATSTVSVNLHNYPVFDSHTNTIWGAQWNPQALGVEFNDTTFATSTTVSVDTSGNTVAFDSHTNTIWFAAYNNGPTIMNDTTFATTTLAASYYYAGYSGYMAFDTHTNTMWFGSGHIMNDTTYATSSFPSPTYDPYGGPIVFDPHTDSMWMTGNNTGGYNTVTQINDTTLAATTYTIEGDPDGGDSGSPNGISFDSATNSIWVTDSNNGTITVFAPNH